MAAAPAAREQGAASAPQVQGPQAEPALGAEGARNWDRDWDAMSDPLGGKALPLVMEVYGWLGWASSGITRGMRNRRSDAVFLRRHGGNREVPAGGWVAQEDHERVLQVVIRAGGTQQGADVEANNWLPRALRTVPGHWRYRRRNPPPPQPQPPHKRRRR